MTALEGAAMSRFTAASPQSPTTQVSQQKLESQIFALSVSTILW